MPSARTTDSSPTIRIEGRLAKQRDWRSSYRLRYVKLFSAGLLEYSLGQDELPRGRFSLAGAKVEEAGRTDIRVSLPEARPLNLRCGSVEERGEWVSALAECAVVASATAKLEKEAAEEARKKTVEAKKKAAKKMKKEARKLEAPKPMVEVETETNLDEAGVPKTPEPEEQRKLSDGGFKEELSVPCLSRDSSLSPKPATQYAKQYSAQYRTQYSMQYSSLFSSSFTQCLFLLIALAGTFDWLIMVARLPAHVLKWGIISITAALPLCMCVLFVHWWMMNAWPAVVDVSSMWIPCNHVYSSEHLGEFLTC
mmetsp:Transcript_20071/g.48101  ORF Transcript_20071/g.48101 Transcript_20071/m.48101 type:complete len:310 (+) Transcript_20071:107-1036(+)